MTTFWIESSQSGCHGGSLCRDNGMPLRVVNMMKHGAFLDAALGKEVGTIVTV